MKPIAHIMIATDLTNRSERALARAFGLQSELGSSRLSVLHIVAEGLPPELATQQQTGAQAFLATRLGHSTSDANGPELQADVLVGDPFGTVIREALIRHADLVVIGEPGVPHYADLFTGTTAERIIRFSDCPVLMVKRDHTGTYARVLIAFDGSEGSIRAMQTAFAIAPRAEFRIVHAWWPPRTMVSGTLMARRAIDEDNGRLRHLIDRAVKQHSSSHPEPLKLAVEMLEVNPLQALRNESDWPDLMVLGTHSKSSLATTLSIGKMARHILAEVGCDVLSSNP